MKTQDAIEYFGSQAALAEKLKISQPAVSLWGDKPPPPRQAQIQVLTGGKLRADPPQRLRRRRIETA